MGWGHYKMFTISVPSYVWVCLYLPFLTWPSDHDQIWHAHADWAWNYSNLKKLTHPTQGGFRGSQIQKSEKFHELARKSIKKINPHPTILPWGWELFKSKNKCDSPHPGGGLGGGAKFKKVREMSRTAQKIDTKINPHPTTPTWVWELLKSKKNWPTPPRGVLGGSTIQKAREMSWTAQKINKNITPTPPPPHPTKGGEVLGVKIQKSGKCYELSTNR